MNGDVSLKAEHSPKQEKPSWNFDEGEEIVPGRHAFSAIGGGTNYEAYLAWDDKLYALVVLKMVRPHLVEDESALRTLRLEAEMLERTDHPVVVRGFGAMLEPPRPHVVLEFLEGPHLSRLIRKYGALPVEQLLPLALQLCSALHYLSTEQLIHLDVKPRNIIMGGPPRLIDMSVARSFERAKKIKGHVGTDLYMSPEQCVPRPEQIGPPADVWGLGATLLHAATGEPGWSRPKGFDRDDSAQRFPQLTQGPKPFPKKKVPGDLQDVILACLEPDPSERPTVAEVAEALEGGVSALPRRPVLGRLRPRLR